MHCTGSCITQIGTSCLASLALAASCKLVGSRWVGCKSNISLTVILCDLCKYTNTRRKSRKMHIGTGVWQTVRLQVQTAVVGSATSRRLNGLNLNSADRLHKYTNTNTRAKTFLLTSNSQIQIQTIQTQTQSS